MKVNRKKTKYLLIGGGIQEYKSINLLSDVIPGATVQEDGGSEQVKEVCK